MAQNKDLVADAQTLLEENLSEKKSVESARRLNQADLQNCRFLYACFYCNKIHPIHLDANKAQSGGHQGG